MKHLIPTLLVTLIALVAAPAPAQVITTLKSYRHEDIPPLPPDDLIRADDGTIYGMNPHWLYSWQPDGSGFTILKQLSVGDLDSFSGRLALSGNTLYGATSAGNGINGRPVTVFKMNTDGTGYAVIKTNVLLPQVHDSPGIVLSGNTLYGWGFKINTDGTGYTELADFPAWDFLEDWHLDIQISGDNIFGTTARDGLYGAGTVFRLNTDGTGYTALVDIPVEDKSNLEDYLTVADTTLYGTSFGATSTVFRVNTDGTGYSVLKNDFSSNGESLSVRRLEHSDGFLYGTTASFTNNRVSWAVFKMNTNGTSYTVLTRLIASNNPAAPNGPNAVNVLTVSGGTIYGVAQSSRGFEGAQGGLDGRGGALFKMNTDGSGFAVLHEFRVVNLFPDGRSPGPLTVSDGVLYGMDHTENGLPRVFKMNPDGTGFTALEVSSPFPVIQAGSLRLRLAVSGSTLFGIGEGGASPNSQGTIFRLNTDGTGYATLKEFIWPADPYPPSASLAVSGSTLYGTTPGVVGNPDNGKIFKLNTDGTGYTILHTFSPASISTATGAWTNSDGILGSGELTLSGTALYGTALLGGHFGDGTVFKLNTDGTGFTVLKHFTRLEVPNGYSLLPGPRLTLSGDTVYGISSSDQLAIGGTVFRMNTDGTGFMVVKQFPDAVWDNVSNAFTNSEGASLHLGLALWNSTLYGTTSTGGRFGHGTLFKVNTDGTGFAVLEHLEIKNRYAAFHGGGLQGLVLSGSALYGSAELGGEKGAGAIFRIDLLPTLSIGRTSTNSLAVTWPAVWTDYVLQQNPNGLSSVNWSKVTDAIQNHGTNKSLVVSPINAGRFYRLVNLKGKP